MEFNVPKIEITIIAYIGLLIKEGKSIKVPFSLLSDYPDMDLLLEVIVNLEDSLCTQVVAQEFHCYAKSVTKEYLLMGSRSTFDID